MVEAVPPRTEGDEAFGHIPSKKLLYELLVQTRGQLTLGWGSWAPMNCSSMARLWGFLQAVAKHSVRKGNDPDGAAGRFLSAWKELDEKAGSPPADRSWHLPSREADARQNLIEAYLVEAGPTSLTEAEPVSPEKFLSEKEVGG